MTGKTFFYLPGRFLSPNCSLLIFAVSMSFLLVRCTDEVTGPMIPTDSHFEDLTLDDLVELEIPSEVKDANYSEGDVSTLILGPLEFTGFDEESTDVFASGYIRIKSTTAGIVSVEYSEDLVLALGINAQVFIDDPAWNQRLIDMFENSYPISGKTDGWLSDLGDWFVRNLWGDREHGPCNNHTSMQFRLYWYDHWLWGEHSFNTEPCPN